MHPQDKVRGLHSIHEQRRFPKRGPTGTFWLVLLGSFVLLVFLHSFWQKRELQKEKEPLIDEVYQLQREWKTPWEKIKNNVEGWVVDLSKLQSSSPNKKEQNLGQFDESTVIYFHLNEVAATNSESIRKIANESLHDGFSTCFFKPVIREESSSKTCKDHSDCDPSLICSEGGFCSSPKQPMLWRLTYPGFEIIEPEWIEKIENADRMTLKVLRDNQKNHIQNDLPIAEKVISRAKFVMIVLYQKMPFAKIGIWRLSDNMQMIYASFEPQIEIMGDKDIPKEVLDAENRQGNRCSVALQLKKWLE